MTPPTDPPRHRSADPHEPAERDELVDLLASCALDGMDADQQDLDAAESAGITADEIERRRTTFAALRDSLLDETADPQLDAVDAVSERRRERAIAAAVTDAARPAKQRLDASATSPAAVTLAPRRRLTPILVAAAVLVVAGIGALAVSSGDDSEDTASSGAAVQLDAATDGSDVLPTTTLDPPSVEARNGQAGAGQEDASESPSADTEATSDAPTSPTVLDLGPLDSLNAAFDALIDGNDLAGGSRPDVAADTACVVQMAIEGYRAVATVRVGTTLHLLGETTTGELAAFRSSDCTVVARRSS